MTDPAAPLLSVRNLTIAFPSLHVSAPAVRGINFDLGREKVGVIGESAAGRRFNGNVAPGEAVRIFTGAPMPEGADTILMQENADGVGTGTITVRVPASKGQFVRVAGLDFSEGDVPLTAGRVLDSAALGLAAAMGHPYLPVRRKPRVAILATGDELVAPGEPTGPDQIVASNSFSLMGLVKKAGGEALDLGIARDDHDDLAARIDAAQAAEADVLITLGGASVGLQIGGDRSELILLVRSQSALDAFLSKKFQLGAEASVAAGPVGAGTGGEVDAPGDLGLDHVAVALGVVGRQPDVLVEHERARLRERQPLLGVAAGQLVVDRERARAGREAIPVRVQGDQHRHDHGAAADPEKSAERTGQSAHHGKSPYAPRVHGAILRI